MKHPPGGKFYYIVDHPGGRSAMGDDPLYDTGTKINEVAIGPSDVGLRNFPLTRNVWGSSDEIPMFYFNPPIRLHFLYGHDITYGRFKQVCMEKPRDSICMTSSTF